jgi:FkbM family methyltransferase
MLDDLMRWYGRAPLRAQRLLRRYLVKPGKQLLSRGVIRQNGFVITKQLDQSIPFILWRAGSYEPALSAMFREFLRPGDTFFDIGANVGYFTLLAASRVGKTGKVHSFEPNPPVFRELERNVALNGFDQVIPNDCALSDRAEMVELWVNPEVDSGLSSLRRTSEILTQTITRRAIRLDDYVVQNQIGKIRAMKLDVEGAEQLVLQGAQTLLTSVLKPDVIALESVQSHAVAFGRTTDAVVQFLVAKGYRVCVLTEDDAAHFRLADFNLAAGVPDSTLVAMREGPL